MPAAIEATEQGCRIRIHAAPKSSRTRVLGYYDDRVKIQLAAPPVDGAANDELVRFLSKTLGIPKADVRLTAGMTGKRKTVEIEELDVVTVAELLGLEPEPKH